MSSERSNPEGLAQFELCKEMFGDLFVSKAEWLDYHIHLEGRLTRLEIINGASVVAVVITLVTLMLYLRGILH